MFITHPNPSMMTPPTWHFHPDSNDTPRGAVLSPRDAQTVLAGAGACMLVGRAAFGQTDTCVVRPDLTEGPAPVNAVLKRSDIRYDPTDDTIQSGAPFDIAFVVTEVIDGVCVPLANAIVEVWHCDAEGRYSGVSEGGYDTTDKIFLRGYQVTDENGMVNFTTIYPGWYPGRAVHIHFKVRSAPKAATHFEFTSQLFLDDLLTDTVYTTAPYLESGIRDTLNEEDPIYQEEGSQMMLDVSSDDGLGYLTVFSIALDLDGSAAASLADLAGIDQGLPAAIPAEHGLESGGLLGALLGRFAGTRI